MTCRENGQWADRWQRRNTRSRKIASIDDKPLFVNYSDSCLVIQSDYPARQRRSPTVPTAACALRIADIDPTGAASAARRRRPGAATLAASGLAAAAAAGRRPRRRAAAGRADRGAGHPDRDPRRDHPGGDRSQSPGQLPPSRAARAAAARDRPAGGRLGGAAGQRPARRRPGERAAVRPLPSRRVADRARRRQPVRDPQVLRAAAGQRPGPSDRDRPGRLRPPPPVTTVNGARSTAGPRSARPGSRWPRRRPSSCRRSRAGG